MHPSASSKAPPLLFPLLVATQVGSVLVIAAYVLFAPAATDVQADLEFRLLPFTPLVWVALAILGCISLVVWRSGVWRIGAIVATSLSGAIGLLGSAAVVLILFVASSYGANFDYPRAAPLPPFADPIVRANGYDDDDPMRGREVVIDIGEHQVSELLDFYQERFTPQAGWVHGAAEKDVGGGHLLCLVNHEEPAYDEYLEVYPYTRRATSSGPHRFLVSISRLDASDPQSSHECGLAGIWFPSDL